MGNIMCCEPREETISAASSPAHKMKNPAQNLRFKSLLADMDPEKYPGLLRLNTEDTPWEI